MNDDDVYLLRRTISDYAVYNLLGRDARIVEFRAERIEPGPVKP